MKIGPINSVNYSRDLSNGKTSHPITIRIPNSSAKNNISFGQLVWGPIGRWVLEANPKELQELAEGFHKSSPEVIKEATTLKTLFFNIRLEDKSRWACDILTGAVEKVKIHKKNIMNELSELKQTNYNSNRIKEIKNEIKRLNIEADNVRNNYMYDPEKTRARMGGSEI